MPVFLPYKFLNFPPVEYADNDGLLAVGGNLLPKTLLMAYEKGIFPWYNEGDPILWWTPDPRFVLFPNELKIAKSMRPFFNQNKFNVTFDTCFYEVMTNCQVAERKGQGGGTWITTDIVKAYCRLHDLGHAHSVEVWDNAGQLVGGLYGVALGKCFFGESMFANQPNASKFGFITLVRWLEAKGFWLIDCQQQTAHLKSLGAKAIPRHEFLEWLEKNNVNLNNEYLEKWVL